jgi:hypothetical protein
MRYFLQHPFISSLLGPNILLRTLFSNTLKYDISGSHGGEHIDGYLLGCCAVWSGRSLLTFQRYLLPPSSGRCGYKRFSWQCLISSDELPYSAVSELVEMNMWSNLFTHESEILSFPCEVNCVRDVLSGLPSYQYICTVVISSLLLIWFTVLTRI